MNSFNQVSNQANGGFSHQTNLFQGGSQNQEENYLTFEQFHGNFQSNIPSQAYTQSQNVYLAQQKQLPLQQDSGKKKTNLSIKSKNFQNSFASFPRFSSQTSIEPTYETATDVTLSSVATESIVNSDGIISNALAAHPVEHLDLANFKVRPCSHNTQHNHKQCPFYHNAKDRKRADYFYSSDLCEYAENSENCPNGDVCTKAHNRVEQLYRPEKYKTKFCGHYPHNLHLCEYSTFCSFAHNEQDITIDLIHNYEYDDDFYMFHFKTVWCPFNLSQHDKALCVYAHNWQDYRRKPNVHSYEAVACPNWKPTDFIVNYEDGCPLKESCAKCHGWKELEYHPLNYKTKHCPSKNCTKGRDCPHYHLIKERRAITSNIANRVFKLMPKNRIVTGTFKKRKEEATSNSQKYIGSMTSLDEYASQDTAPSFPTSLNSINDLPTHEQLKWMNNMIQTMMAAHSLNDEGLGTLETKDRESHKRRSSVDSPYFGDKKKKEPTQPMNHHVKSLFGDARKCQQYVQTSQLAPTDDMYRAILESPLTLFTSRSVRDVQETRSKHFEQVYHANEEDLDSATRHGLERLINTEEF